VTPEAAPTKLSFARPQKASAAKATASPGPPKALTTNDSVARLKNARAAKNQTSRGPKGHASKMKLSRGPEKPKQQKRQRHLAPEAAMVNKSMRGPERPLQQTKSSRGPKGVTDESRCRKTGLPMTTVAPRHGISQGGGQNKPRGGAPAKRMRRARHSGGRRWAQGQRRPDPNEGGQWEAPPKSGAGRSYYSQLQKSSKQQSTGWCMVSCLKRTEKEAAPSSAPSVCPCVFMQVTFSACHAETAQQLGDEIGRRTDP